MKKLLSLLSILTISGTAMPSAIAAKKYEKEETINKTNTNYQQTNKIEIPRRKKRQTPPSLQNIITTVNIGEIEINDQENIITRLREINHPILSRPEFLANIVIENITPNSALVYTRTNIQTEQFLLPSSIIFTINFNTQRPLLSTIIRNRNLGNIYTTIYDLRNFTISFGHIIAELRRLNPNLTNDDNEIWNYITINHLHSHLRGTQIGLTREGQEFYTDDRVFITFNNYLTADILNSILIFNTNLGELPDNNPQTILQRVTELNPKININNFIIRENSITQNSAQIFLNDTYENIAFLNYQNILNFSIQNLNLPIDCNNPDSFVYNFNHFSSTSKSVMTDEDENIKFCYKNNLYFNQKNDYFRVWYNFLRHDGIELKLSFKTVVFLKKFIELNNKEKIKEYLKKLIDNINQKDETGFGGAITDNDKKLMINFICDGYLNFHDEILKWIKNIKINPNVKNYSMFIRTWRTYNWSDLNDDEKNSSFYISKESQNDNYDYINYIKNKIELRNSNYNNYIKFQNESNYYWILYKIDENNKEFKNWLSAMGFNSDYLWINLKFLNYLKI